MRKKSICHGVHDFRVIPDDTRMFGNVIVTTYKCKRCRKIIEKQTNQIELF